MQTMIEMINIKITAPPAAIPAIAPTGSPPAPEEEEASGEAEGEMVEVMESEGVPEMMAPPLVVVFFGGAAVVVAAVGFGFGLGAGFVVVGFGSIMYVCVFEKGREG